MPKPTGRTQGITGGITVDIGGGTINRGGCRYSSSPIISTTVSASLDPSESSTVVFPSGADLW